MRIAVLALAAILFGGAHAAHAQSQVPGFWGPKQRLSKPDISALPRLRFLTTVDFFPFNFMDSNGLLSGFHIDLARLICAQLQMADRCQIQAMPWEELEPALEANQGEALIAGLAINAESRGKYLFSRPYMRFPSRFVTRKAQPLAEPLYTALAGKRVGVAASTAHERMLRDLFPGTRPVTYSRLDWQLDDLRQGKIDAVFSDGMRLGLWLADDGASCCAFAGGPYLAPEYLGQGLAIAVPHDATELVDALDFALHEIETSGAFAELYQRYFPISFY